MEKEKIKVIMLDIDGPVSYVDHAAMDRGDINLHRLTHEAWHPAALKCLDDLSAEIDNLYMVISSTWRQLFPERMWWCDQFKEAGYHNIRVAGVTGYADNRYRGREVNNWLETRGKRYDVVKYLCVDDDSDFYSYQPFYHTRGLSDVDFDIMLDYFQDGDELVDSLFVGGIRRVESRNINDDESSLTWTK